MPIWSSSTVLLLIDLIAIAIAQGYTLARVRLTSHPSPVLRVTAGRDDAIMRSEEQRDERVHQWVARIPRETRGKRTNMRGKPQRAREDSNLRPTV